MDIKGICKRIFGYSKNAGGSEEMTVELDEGCLSERADVIFERAVLAKKQAATTVAFKRDSTQVVEFNVVLEDGTVENRGASIPPGGVAVVQPGGEINVISDFEDLYEVVREGVTTELAARQREAVERAGIETSMVHSLTEFTAAARQRIDEYVKLPFG